MVSGRVLIAHDDNPEILSMTGDVVYEDADKIRYRAVVITRKGEFVGHAESYKKTGSPQEKKSPLEVAETSAYGRALGFAGYAIEDGIASANEVENAIARPEAAPHPDSPAAAPKTTTRTAAAPAKETSTVSLTCADCKNDLQDVPVGNGVMPAQELAEKTHKTFGRSLCVDCGAKAKAVNK